MIVIIMVLAFFLIKKRTLSKKQYLQPAKSIRLFEICGMGEKNVIIALRTT